MFGFGKKKKDDLGLDKDFDFGKDDLNLGLDDPLANSKAGAPFGMPPQQAPPEDFPDFGASQPSSFGDFNQHQMQQNFQVQPAQQISGQDMLQKDLQIITAKLDAIKSELNAMNQRIVKIEQIADEEYQKQMKKRVW